MQSSEQFDKIGEIASGKAPSQETSEQITLCDLTGTGVQDIAIANLAYRRAVELSAGISMQN